MAFTTDEMNQRLKNQPGNASETNSTRVPGMQDAESVWCEAILGPGEEACGRLTIPHKVIFKLA
jgi:hypothetical protein